MGLFIYKANCGPGEFMGGLQKNSCSLGGQKWKSWKVMEEPSKNVKAERAINISDQLLWVYINNLKTSVYKVGRSHSLELEMIGLNFPLLF